MFYRKIQNFIITAFVLIFKNYIIIIMFYDIGNSTLKYEVNI